MKIRIPKWIRKTLLYSGITIVSLLLILFLLPYIMPGTISKKIKILVNQSIDGKVEFSKARLSFFNHFPSLTLTLHDFTSTGSTPYENENLLSAGEMAFGISLLKLLKGDIHVNKLYISDATINVKVNENGDANYNIYKSTSTGIDTSASSPDTTTRLKIQKIQLDKCYLIYDDKSADILIKAKGLNYRGNGDLTKSIFDLKSHLVVDSFDLFYDDEHYIDSKKINAELITKINTHSLAFEFTRNRLRINELPLEVTGKYEFLDRGYLMDFEAHSVDADFYDVFTVLPPSYREWLNNTRIKGSASLDASLKGIYIGGTDTMPDINFNMDVREGFIDYADAPFPLSELYIDFNTKLPDLNLDSLQINLDTSSFKVDNSRFTSILKTKGYDAPYIYTRTNSTLDLEKFDRALGLTDYNLKGILNFRLLADGRYATGQNPHRIREDIVITSIPSFSLQSELQNGYFHYTPLPAPLERFNFKLNAACPDHNKQNINLSVEDIDIKMLNNYIKGFLRLKNTGDFPIEAELDAICDLGDIKKCYPLDSAEIAGKLEMKIKSTGNYLPDKKQFPKTEAVLKLENALVKTNYYPAPMENINVNATILNDDGTMKGLKVNIQPLSFLFEGKPFIVKADLQNFDDLHYNISSNGELDLGKIYKVFAYEGWDVIGTIHTDFTLKGTQSDATAGRYHSLDNHGTVKVNKLTVYSDLYPEPFEIESGTFKIHQDHLQFTNLKTVYASSSAELTGYFSNIFNYINNSGPLKGEVHVRSPYILLNELMAYDTGPAEKVNEPNTTTLEQSSGVIMIPAGLDLTFSSSIDKVEYHELEVKNIKGKVVIKNEELMMNDVGFELAGAVTKMNATYKCINPSSAGFTYHIVMDSLDVKKMYNEVPLFREFAPAAKGAEGIISLDYELEGELDRDMYPVLPSLKGKGVLGLKKVKVKGLKLFSAMGKETGKDDIKNPDLSKINLKTTVANNTVTLEKTKIKVAGFRIKLQGKSTFDGNIHFNCRVGLPPFGIIGIPITATGNGENPKIKVGKKDELSGEEKKAEEEDHEVEN